MKFKYGLLILWVITLLLCGCHQKNSKQVSDPGEMISIKTLGSVSYTHLTLPTILLV